jgi:hypothetical protein
MKVITKSKKNRIYVQKKSLEAAKFSLGNDNSEHERLKLLARTVHEHPWTYATIDAVARSALGAGWKYVPVERYKNDATNRQRKKLEDFFEYRERKWDNIKDFQSLPDKIGQTVAAYRLFGHLGWEIIRDARGVPIGFDVLSGILSPRVSDSGYFQNPAFTFYPWEASGHVTYKLDEVAYFYNSGVTGRISGESSYESLINTSLPSDIFAAVSYRSLFENVNAPYNGVWTVDPQVSDEDLEAFIGLLEERYSGAVNFGRNPLVIRGNAEFKPTISRNDEDAPYLDGRAFNREEFYGVTGVDGNKLGITSDANKSNIRETRREFHENVLRPLFRRLEDDIYNQVIVRILGIRGWKMQFNQPDITNALEQASIDMRYMQWGVYSPNEIREQRGEDKREDGDFYYVPLNMARSDREEEMQQDQQTRPNSDNNENSDDPMPNDTSGEPVRVPRDDETGSPGEASKAAIAELKKWRKKYLEFLDKKRTDGDFSCLVVEKEVEATVKSLLAEAGNDFNLVKNIFEGAVLVYGRSNWS